MMTVKTDAQQYFPEIDLTEFWDDDELALAEYDIMGHREIQ